MKQYIKKIPALNVRFRSKDMGCVEVSFSP